MRKIANGILFDTAKSTALFSVFDRNEDETVTLYKSPNSRYFFVGVNDSYHEPHARFWQPQIEDVFNFLEKHRANIGADLCDDLYTNEFSNHIQEA